jgi:hypothetical protein
MRFARILVLLAAALGMTVGFGGVAGAQSENPFTFGLGVNSNDGSTQKLFHVLSGQGTWTFLVTVKGNVNTLVLSIRDSSPGDFCWFWSVKRPKGTFAVTAEDMPAAVLNACPGEQFEDSNGDHLAFFSGFQGGKNGGVTVTVAYPPRP